MPDQTDPTPRAMLAAIQTLRVPTDAELSRIADLGALQAVPS